MKYGILFSYIFMEVISLKKQNKFLILQTKIIWAPHIITIV